MGERQLISIICPVYNEQENILIFYERLTKVIRTFENRFDFELIFTNNRSTDKTPDIILDLHKKNPTVQILTLSRNFGYQASVLAGMSFAQGDATVVIDVDCEDPPEMIADFINYWQEGNDIVYGIRKKRPEPFIIQWMRNLFYWLLYKLGDHEVILNMAEFALISRAVREEILNNKSTFPFLRTEIGYVGFKRLGIPYSRHSRRYGKTHYNFWTMLAFAVGGILSSSTFLLRLSAFIGAELLLINVVLLILELLMIVPKAFMILVTFDLMYIIFFLSVLSVYNARIYKNGVQRPVFVIDWKHSTYPRPLHSQLPTAIENTTDGTRNL